MFNLDHFLQGASAVLTVEHMLCLVVGSFFGVVLGIIPGLGPMIGMVLLLPFSFQLDSALALSLLLGVFCGGFFGGGIPAVLMRTPGVPASLVTSFDGFPLTQRGEAQTALSACLVGSFFGGIFSVVILIFLAPILAHVAASFGPPEYFAVGIFGVSLVVMANRKSLMHSMLLLCLGLMFSTIGIDATTLTARFSFNTVILQTGLSLVAIFLGLYGIGQTLLLTERKLLLTDEVQLSRSSLDFSKIVDVMRYWKTMIRSGLIGTFLGLLPGTGTITSGYMAYEAAKKSSPYPERFGTGYPEGCVASEAANNAVPAGAMIPLLTLGIPGEAISAVLLGIFTINGIYPGPLLLVKEPVLINTLYVSMLLINVICFIMLAFWIRPFSTIVKLPTKVLAILIMVCCLTGIYSIETRLFDVGVAIVMGIMGYIFLRLKWPLVTFVVGVVLGPIIEDRLRESLSISNGNPIIFLTRPISLALFILTILIIIVPIFRERKSKPGN